MHPLVICYFYKHLIIIHVGNWIPVQCSKHLSSTHQLHHVFWQGQGQSQLHPITDRDRGKVSYIPLLTGTVAKSATSHHRQGQGQSQLHPITDRDRGKVSYIPTLTRTVAKSATSSLGQGQRRDSSCHARWNKEAGIQPVSLSLHFLSFCFSK